MSASSHRPSAIGCRPAANYSHLADGAEAVPRGPCSVARDPARWITDIQEGIDMTRFTVRLLLVSALLTGLFLCGACNKNKANEAGSKEIGEIMNKLNPGPQPLKELLATGLQQDSPDWAMIQQQTKEFARLAASLGEYPPPKGSQESWTKLAAAYADSAVALDKAAQAKDKNAAQDAQKAL